MIIVSGSFVGCPVIYRLSESQSCRCTPQQSYDLDSYHCRIHAACEVRILTFVKQRAERVNASTRVQTGSCAYATSFGKVTYAKKTLMNAPVAARGTTPLVHAKMTPDVKMKGEAPMHHLDSNASKIKQFHRLKLSN